MVSVLRAGLDTSAGRLFILAYLRDPARCPAADDCRQYSFGGRRLVGYLLAAAAHGRPVSEGASRAAAQEAAPGGCSHDPSSESLAGWGGGGPLAGYSESVRGTALSGYLRHGANIDHRSEAHTSTLPSLICNSNAVFRLK